MRVGSALGGGATSRRVDARSRLECVTVEKSPPSRVFFAHVGDARGGETLGGEL